MMRTKRVEVIAVVILVSMMMLAECSTRNQPKKVAAKEIINNTNTIVRAITATIGPIKAIHNLLSNGSDSAYNLGSTIGALCTAYAGTYSGTNTDGNKPWPVELVCAVGTGISVLVYAYRAIRPAQSRNDTISLFYKLAMMVAYCGSYITRISRYISPGSYSYVSKATIMSVMGSLGYLLYTSAVHRLFPSKAVGMKQRTKDVITNTLPMLLVSIACIASIYINLVEFQVSYSKPSLLLYTAIPIAMMSDVMNFFNAPKHYNLKVVSQYALYGISTAMIIKAIQEYRQ